MSKGTSSKRKSREQRRHERERERSRPVESRVVEADEPDEASDTNGEEPRAIERAERADQARPEAFVQPGLMEKLFGSGRRSEEPETGLVHYGQKPGLLRPFARRNYQREAALSSIRRGFEDLSDLMADIRDGLHDSVDRQGELLEQMKYLPVVAEQNARSAERFEEQFKQNNQQLARSNDLAGENIKLQGEALRHQAESVKALRDQIRGQSDQSERLNAILGTMGKESRDQKRDLDDFQGRLDRMRQSDQAIADNLGSVAGAIRRVSDQTATQGQLVAQLQEAMDQRTRRLEEEVDRRSRTQGWMLLLALLLAFIALGAVAAVGVLYLRQTGVLQ